MAGARTELAKQTMVRYIREGGLKSGDRLPAQEELRKELGFGSATIAAALHELRADRVLEVRDKIGVFVVNPDADGHAGREIGLAINALEVSAFRSSLANLIQIRLAERGWRAIPFFCMAPTLTGKLELSAFPGLRRTIDQKGIEALVTLGDFSESSLKFFRAKKLPVVFVGSLETDSARVVIDMPGFLHSAMAELCRKGCRRPGILISEALKPRLAPEFAAAGGAPELLFTGNYVPDGAAAARQIQGLPETARPDGMVIFDDTLASSFVAELYRQRTEKRPRLAILRNRQNPMDFADDNPLFFEVDLNELADMTAKLLQQEFNGDSATNELKYTLIMK